MINENGKEIEVKVVLSCVIEKFERYFIVYECCGFVNYRLCNYFDVLYDYSKSIDINFCNVEVYFGCVFVYIVNDEI